MSIGRDSLAYWTSQAANFLLSFVSSVFVAVILGPELRGLVTAVILANNLGVNLTNLGVQALSMYFIGKQREQLSRFHTLIVWIVAAIIVADLLAIAIFGDALRRSVFDDIAWPYFALAVAGLPFALYYFAAQGVMTGLGRVRELSRFLFYYSVAFNSANLVVVGLLPWKVSGLLVVWLAGQIGAAAALAVMVRRSGCRWVAMSARETLGGAGELLSYGLRAFVGNFATTLVNYMDQLFILAGPGRVGLGVYGIAAKIATLISQPSASLETASYARVASAQRRDSATLVQEIFRANFLINGAAVALLALLAKPFILFFYREEYAAVVLPLRILLPGVLCLSCSRMLAMYFSAQLGKPQIPSTIAWLTLGVNVPLMGYVVIAREGGLVGAASVTAASYGVMLVCYLVLFALRTGLVNPAAYFIPQARDFERVRRLAREVLARRGI